MLLELEKVEFWQDKKLVCKYFNQTINSRSGLMPHEAPNNVLKHFKRAININIRFFCLFH